MPNWSFNTVAIRGAKNEVINFLNEGLKRTHGRKKSFSPIAENASTAEIKEKLDKYGLSLRSWLPMPRTFIQWDTTNSMKNFDWWLQDTKRVSLSWKEIQEQLEELQKQYGEEYQKYCDGYNKAKQHQLKKYGVAGWYDYNCMTLGTKWNSRIESWSFQNENEDEFLITFYCETAWSLPDRWVCKMQDLHPNLHFGCFATEESYAYLGFMDGHDGMKWVENHEYSEVEARVKVENPGLDEDSDESWEIYSETYNDLSDETFGHFIDYMNDCYEPA